MYITTSIDVDEVLAELDDSDLISELESRGYSIPGHSHSDFDSAVHQIWMNRRLEIGRAHV